MKTSSLTVWPRFALFSIRICVFRSVYPSFSKPAKKRQRHHFRLGINWEGNRRLYHCRYTKGIVICKRWFRNLFCIVKWINPQNRLELRSYKFHWIINGNLSPLMKFIYIVWVSWKANRINVLTTVCDHVRNIIICTEPDWPNDWKGWSMSAGKIGALQRAGEIECLSRIICLLINFKTIRKKIAVASLTFFFVEMMLQICNGQLEYEWKYFSNFPKLKIWKSLPTMVQIWEQ